MMYWELKFYRTWAGETAELVQCLLSPQTIVVHVIIILALQGEKQENQKFKATLGYLECLKPTWTM